MSGILNLFFNNNNTDSDTDIYSDSDGETMSGGMGNKRQRGMNDNNPANTIITSNNRKQNKNSKGKLLVRRKPTTKNNVENLVNISNQLVNFDVSGENIINVDIDLGLIVLFFFDMIHDFCETPVLMSTNKNAKQILASEIKLIIEMFDATFSDYFNEGNQQTTNIVSDILTKITKIINVNKVKYSRDFKKVTNDKYIFEDNTYQRVYDLIIENYDNYDYTNKNKVLYDFINECFKKIENENDRQIGAGTFLERGHELCYFISSVINDRYFFKKHKGLIDMNCSNNNQPSILTFNVELEQCKDYKTMGNNALLLTNETDYNILQLPNIKNNNKYFDLLGREIDYNGNILQKGNLNIVRPVYLIEDALKSTSKVSFLQSCVCSSAEGNNLSTSKEMYVLYTTSGFYDEAANKLACYEPLAPPDDNYMNFNEYNKIQSNMQIEFTPKNIIFGTTPINTFKCNFQALNEEQLIENHQDYKQQLFIHFKKCYQSILNEKENFNNLLNEAFNDNNFSFVFGSLLDSDSDNQGNYYGQIPNVISSGLKSEYNTKIKLSENTRKRIQEINELLKNTQSITNVERKIYEKEKKEKDGLLNKIEKEIKKLKKDIHKAITDEKSYYEISKTVDNVAPKMVDALKTFISDTNVGIGFTVPSKKTIFKRIRKLSNYFGLGIVGYDDEDENFDTYGFYNLQNSDIDFGIEEENLDINNSNVFQSGLDDLQYRQNQKIITQPIRTNPIMEYDEHYIDILTFSKNGTINVEYNNIIVDNNLNDMITKIQKITIPEIVKKIQINNEDFENFIMLLFNYYIFDGETIEETIDNNNPTYIKETNSQFINKSPVLELFNLYSTQTENYFDDLIRSSYNDEKSNFILKPKTKNVNLQIEKQTEKGYIKTDNVPDASVTNISQIFREKLYDGLTKKLNKRDPAYRARFIEENIGTRTDGISEYTSNTLVNLYNSLYENNNKLTKEQLVELFLILFRKTMGDFSQIATVKHLSTRHSSKPIWFISFDVMAGIIALYHGANTISVRLKNGKLNDGYVLYGCDMLKYKYDEKVVDNNDDNNNDDNNTITPNSVHSQFNSQDTQVSDVRSVHSTTTINVIESLNTMIHNKSIEGINPYVESGPDKTINIVYFKMEQEMCKYKEKKENDSHSSVSSEFTQGGGKKIKEKINKHIKTIKHNLQRNKNNATRKQQIIDLIKKKLTKKRHSK